MLCLTGCRLYMLLPQYAHVFRGGEEAGMIWVTRVTARDVCSEHVD